MSDSHTLLEEEGLPSYFFRYCTACQKPAKIGSSKEGNNE